MGALRHIGVIGTGIIGKPIAERLLKAGLAVFVYDVRPEPVAALAAQGAVACTSAADVASRCDLVISLVFDQPQTDDVVRGARGIVHALKPGTIFATGSTLDPAYVQEIAGVLAARGYAALDMPITGGFLAAADGKLVLMVGGAPEVLERARPVFETYAHVITHTGDVGTGQAAKLAHQLVMGTNILALLEGLALGAAGGVEPAVLKRIFAEGIASSGVLGLWNEMGPRWKSMLQPGAPGAPLPNLRKDLHTALALARAHGVELPVAARASAVADTGTATGHGDCSL